MAFSPDVRFTDTVDGQRLLDWMVDAFYDPARPPWRTAYLPLLVDQVERGRTDVLYPWLKDHMGRLLANTHWAWGLYRAVNCQEQAPSVDREAVTLRFGLDARYRPLFLLPPLAALLTVALVALTLRAWLRGSDDPGRESRLAPVVLTLVAVAALAYGALMARWGFWSALL